MQDLNTILTAGAIAALFMELIKWVVRKFILKDESYDFSVLFYTLGLAVLNIFTPFLLFWLGFEVESPVLGLGWLEILKYTISVILGVLVSTGSYKLGIKPLKTYSDDQKELNEG